jgi:hypothetical protein
LTLHLFLHGWVALSPREAFRFFLDYRLEFKCTVQSCPLARSRERPGIWGLRARRGLVRPARKPSIPFSCGDPADAAVMPR